jgi:hypothetical protein
MVTRDMGETCRGLINREKGVKGARVVKKEKRTEGVGGGQCVSHTLALCSSVIVAGGVISRRKGEGDDSYDSLLLRLGLA